MAVPGTLWLITSVWQGQCCRRPLTGTRQGWSEARGPSSDHLPHQVSQVGSADALGRGIRCDAGAVWALWGVQQLPWLYPPDTSGLSPSPSYDNQRCPQTFAYGPLENHSSTPTAMASPFNYLYDRNNWLHFVFLRNFKQILFSVLVSIS